MNLATYPSLMFDTRILEDGIIKIPELKNRSNEDVHIVLVFKQSNTKISSVDDGFDFQSYKKKIENIPLWTEDEIKVFDQNNQLFKQWTIEEF